MANGKTRDYSGQKYGTLTCIEPTDKCNVRGLIIWKCICDCGNVVEKVAAYICSNAKIGKTPSCGCRRRLGRGIASRNRVLESYKRGAKRRGLEWSLTDEEALILFAGDCYYCGDSPSHNYNPINLNGGFQYNGIDRLNSDDGYTVSNSVSCCWDCNRIKGRMNMDEFEQYILIAYKNSCTEIDR